MKKALQICEKDNNYKRKFSEQHFQNMNIYHINTEIYSDIESKIKNIQQLLSSLNNNKYY